MKPNTPNHNLPDFDRDLENDAVWNLLEDATSRDPSPRFVQDTLRRARLDNETSSCRNPSWWKSLLAPKSLLLGASGAAVAALAIVLSLPSNPVTPEEKIAAAPGSSRVELTDTAAIQDWDDLEDSVAYELLSGAAEDPTLLSDGEIVTLLY
jgi:hypothetical protein